MNLPNKITISRIILTIFIILILIAPLESFGIELPKLFISEKIVVDVKYFIAGFLFVVAAITDMFDGMLARKLDLITDYGKMIDAIADKVLVNTVLIILASTGFIPAIIPVVIIFRDTVVDAIKMSAGNKGKVVAASKLGKLKTICMMTGITMTLFYNLPFELWNVRVSNIILILATILSVISGVEYYSANKKYFKEETNY